LFAKLATFLILQRYYIFLKSQVLLSIFKLFMQIYIIFFDYASLMQKKRGY